MKRKQRINKSELLKKWRMRVCLLTLKPPKVYQKYFAQKLRSMERLTTGKDLTI